MTITVNHLLPWTGSITFWDVTPDEAVDALKQILLSERLTNQFHLNDLKILLLSELEYLSKSTTITVRPYLSGPSRSLITTCSPLLSITLSFMDLLSLVFLAHMAGLFVTRVCHTHGLGLDFCQSQ